MTVLLKKKKQNLIKSRSVYARVFQMFKDKRLIAEVSKELDIRTNAVLDFYSAIKSIKN
jgi:hypothetical protein